MLLPWQRNWRELKQKPLLGLTDAQVNSLTDLQSSPAYAIFRTVLQQVAEHNAGVMLTYKDYGDIRERLGFVKALRHVIDLIPLLVEESKRLEDERSKRHAATNGDDWDTRHFYGSPWYDRIRGIRRTDSQSNG